MSVCGAIVFLLEGRLLLPSLPISMCMMELFYRGKRTQSRCGWERPQWCFPEHNDPTNACGFFLRIYSQLLLNHYHHILTRLYLCSKNFPKIFLILMDHLYVCVKIKNLVEQYQCSIMNRKIDLNNKLVVCLDK